MSNTSTTYAKPSTSAPVPAEAARRALLRRMFSYRLVSRAYFHLPILFVFLYIEGFSVWTVELLLALYGTAILVCGPITSSISRRVPLTRVLVLGEGIKATGLVLIGLVPAALAAVIAGQFLSGLGYALTSSAEGPLAGRLVDDRQQAGRIQARTQSWTFIVVLACGVTGAVLFEHNTRSVFVLSIAACAAAAVIALGLRGPLLAPGARSQDSDSTSNAATTGPRRLSRTARCWAVYYVLIRSVSLACFVGVLPYLFFIQLEVSLAYFGLLLGAYNLAAFVAARWSGTCADRIGDRKVLAATVLSTSGALFLLAGFHRLDVAVVAVLLLGAGSGAARPLTARGQADVPNEHRGWVAVRTEQAAGLLNAGVLVVAGAALNADGDTALLIGLALVVAVCGLAIATAVSVNGPAAPS